MNEETLQIASTVQPGETVFSDTFVMLVRIRGEFSDDQLRSALDRLRARHALLIPSAMNDPEGSHFPLHILTGCGQRDWVEIARIELRRHFASRKGPFARFTLLRTKDCSDLVGAFHHGACDGMTGVFVLRDIVRLLADPALELQPASNPDLSALMPDSVKRNPKIKTRLRFMVGMFRISRFFGQLRKRLFPKAQKKTTAPALLAGTSLPPAQRYCILTRTLTVSRTAALVSRCKAEQTSVHAAVCSAWLRAYANSLEGRKSWVRCVSSPVNLRNRLTRPVEEIAGQYMSGIETRFNCAPEQSFWQVARKCKEQMQRDSSEEKLFMMPMMFDTFFASFSEEDLDELFGKLFNGPFKYDFSITNLGVLNIPTQIGPLQVEAFYNLVNSSEFERTVNVNTLGDKMTLAFVLRESNMEPHKAEALMESALEQLAEAVKQ